MIAPPVTPEALCEPLPPRPPPAPPPPPTDQPLPKLVVRNLPPPPPPAMKAPEALTTVQPHASINKAGPPLAPASPPLPMILPWFMTVIFSTSIHRPGSAVSSDHSQKSDGTSKTLPAGISKSLTHACSVFSFPSIGVPGVGVIPEINSNTRRGVDPSRAHNLVSSLTVPASLTNILTASRIVPRSFTQNLAISTAPQIARHW